MRKSNVALFGVFFASALVTNPVLAETLPIEAVYPAGSDRLSSLNKLKMGRFSGPDGSSLAFELEQQLRNVYIRGENYYEIYVGSGAPRVDGTVTGSANGSVESNRENIRRRVCVARNYEGKCVRRGDRVIACTRRSITLNYTLSVVGNRGERLYSASKPVVSSDLICPDTAGVPPTDVVIAGLVSKVATELRYEFAPAQIRTDVRVKEGTSGLRGDAKRKFKSAVRMTKRNVATACDMWAEVDYVVPNHAPTLFNLGLCAESEQDYDRAEEFYRRTTNINRSERYAVEAIDRLNRRRRADQQLAMHNRGR